jgi:hypothetical protein
MHAEFGGRLPGKGLIIRTSPGSPPYLGQRPLLGAALAAGAVTDSLAAAIADWTRKLPAPVRDETDRILLEAAAAGASVDDLATIAACAIETWRAQQPDADDPDPGDRYIQLGTTFGGAGVIRGDLTLSATPPCAPSWKRSAREPGPRTTAQRGSGSTTRCSWPARRCPASAARPGEMLTSGSSHLAATRRAVELDNVPLGGAAAVVERSRAAGCLQRRLFERATEGRRGSEPR